MLLVLFRMVYFKLEQVMVGGGGELRREGGRRREVGGVFYF